MATKQKPSKRRVKHAKSATQHVKNRKNRYVQQHAEAYPLDRNEEYPLWDNPDRDYCGDHVLSDYSWLTIRHRTREVAIE